MDESFPPPRIRRNAATRARHEEAIRNALLEKAKETDRQYIQTALDFEQRAGDLLFYSSERGRKLLHRPSPSSSPKKRGRGRALDTIHTLAFQVIHDPGEDAGAGADTVLPPLAPESKQLRRRCVAKLQSTSRAYEGASMPRLPWLDQLLLIGSVIALGAIWLWGWMIMTGARVLSSLALIVFMPIITDWMLGKLAHFAAALCASAFPDIARRTSYQQEICTMLADPVLQWRRDRCKLWERGYLFRKPPLLVDYESLIDEVLIAFAFDAHFPSMTQDDQVTAVCLRVLYLYYMRPEEGEELISVGA